MIDEHKLQRIKEIVLFYDKDSMEGTELVNYITKLQEENKRLNNIINKIDRLFEADTHCENIYYAIGVLLNKKYYDIEMIDNKELLNILRGDKK